MRYKRKVLGLLTLAVFVSLSMVSGVRAVPQLIRYEGTLTDAYGNPIPDNTLSMRFRICTAKTVGVVLWKEVQQVEVKNGAYSVLLGSVKPFPANLFLKNKRRWLEVKVGRKAPLPRELMVSVPYALNAESLDGQHASDFAEATHDHIGAVWIANVAWSNGAFKVLNYSNGPSIWGWNGGGGNGIRGYATGSGLGVYGESQDNAGVVGRSTNGNGVEGYGGGSANAGYFSGNVQITGTLSKGGGSFKIDHPLDPENKYLQHSFVESPDMMNVYNGNVILDDLGGAWVKLPEYFEALNSDYRYQLTAIGVPGPNLYIAEKIFDNRFKIAGGQPYMEVSWQVTGIRQDAWAEANRIEVEMDKGETEQGYYLYPEAFDLDETHSVEYIHKQEKSQENVDMEMKLQVMQD